MPEHRSRIAPAQDFDAPLVACPLCGWDRLADFDRDAWGIAIARCSRCDTRLMNPQYTDEALRAFYARYVQDVEGAHSAERQRLRRRSKHRNLALVERFVSPGRLLSIGSGDGLEIEVAKDRGWTVQGYDVDEASARAISARTGVPVLSGNLLALDFGGARFDCVFMDQVLEHLKDPAAYLRHVRTLVHDRGVVYIGVPNIGSLSSRLKTLLGRIGLKRKSRGKHYDAWHHLFYFTASGLRNVLERHFGFEVLLHEGAPEAPAGDGARPPLADRLRARFPVLESTQHVVVRPRSAEGARIARDRPSPNAPRKSEHRARPTTVERTR
ncbi:MAG TPA: class I SAM-dependent methyltransferase [Woeseiaceae bacterium]|nr:class I SAM-dependent methyltransferase [Woeseiaceae bacterium]